MSEYNSMKALRAWLVLCLLLCLQGDWVNIVSPWDPVALTGAAAILPNMSSWIYSASLPNTLWYVMLWVQIKAGTPESARLMLVTPSSQGSPVDFYVTWSSIAVPTFTCGATDHIVSGSPGFRQENAWVQILMGSQAGTSFGYITFRANSNNQFSVSWSEALVITPTSALKAPASANPFYVSTT